jgi:HNH endonuclease
MTRGYGQLSFNGKAIGAHIVSVLLSGRIIPKGHVVMHKCDNKSCVNPKHLLVVLQKHNMADLKKKRIRYALELQRQYQAEQKRKARRKAYREQRAN